MRKKFVIISILVIAAFTALAWFVWAGFWWFVGVFAFLAFVGFYDMVQSRHSITRNFPLFGRVRWLMEDLRPKMYQYFIESDTDGKPINRIDRNTIYQRAKLGMDTIPFGTQLNVYAEGYEWMTHSISPLDFHNINHNPRVIFGIKDCKQPYSGCIFNVSAMR
jgi:energy-coupling factor transporter transmembrane protein EcfT